MNELNTVRNDIVPAESFNVRYSPLDIARIERDAAELRADTVARQMTVVGHAVWRAVKWTVGSVGTFFALLSRSAAARETYDVLSRLSDRQLEDIGLTRDEIPARIIEILGGKDANRQTVASELYALEGGKTAMPKVEAPKRRAA